MDQKGKHFVLIHGACHGAWCWYKVVASLRESGRHRVTALDMAASGIDSVPVEAVSNFHDYFRPLLDFMEALPAGEKVVLVGHSMGGMGISLAMERFPQKILVAVFIAANMPGPNLDYLSIIQEFHLEMEKKEGGWMDSSYQFNNGAENPPTSMLFGPIFMSSQLYNQSPIQMEKKGNHFVLIHGACHGAWCWYKVVASLRESGHHRVTTLDMAASGINTVPVEAVSSFDDYFRPLLDFMEALPAGEKVVLVGHSMGGIGICLAMERFPEKILVAVFVAANMPGPNLDYLSIVKEKQFRREMGKKEAGWMDSSYQFNNGEENPPTSMLFGPIFMSTQLYNLSSIQDLSLAHLLARPFPMIGNEQSDRMIFTEEKYGSVNRVFVMGEHELVYKQDFVKWMIEKNPVRQMITISSADHMIMFSNPLDLCSCLEEIANNN